MIILSKYSQGRVFMPNGVPVKTPVTLKEMINKVMLKIELLVIAFFEKHLIPNIELYDDARNIRGAWATIIGFLSSSRTQKFSTFCLISSLVWSLTNISNSFVKAAARIKIIAIVDSRLIISIS